MNRLNVKSRLWLLALLCIVVGCSSSSMERLGATAEPLAFVQANSAVPNSASTINLAFSSAEVAGHLNVVAIGWNDAGGGPTSVTDSRGNTYQLAIGPNSGGGQVAQSIYYAANVAAGSCTVTVAFGRTANAPDLRIAEYAGVVTSSPIDGTISTVQNLPGGATSITTGNMTTTASGDLLVAADLTAGLTTMAGSGWTSRVLTSPNGDMLEDRTAGGPGSYTASMNLNPGFWTVLQMVAFKAQIVSDGGSEGGSSDGSMGDSGEVGADGDAVADNSDGGNVESSDAGDGAADQSDSTGVTDGDGGGDSTVDASQDQSSDGGDGGDSGVVDAPPDVADAGQEADASDCTPFPLHNSVDNHTLVDNNGNPFPILGRTAWFLPSINLSDRKTFLDDTVAKGYDAVEFMMITRDNTQHVPGAPIPNHAPFDGSGNAPFLKLTDGTSWNGTLGPTPDFTTPNEAYWQNIDSLMADLESRGILALAFPSYTGSGGGGTLSQGWDGEMQSMGTTRLGNYATWVATRYSDLRNIVWMVGGDLGTTINNGIGFNATQTADQSALLAGLQGVGMVSRYYSAEWFTESAGTDQSNFGAQMTLNSAYSFAGNVTGIGRHAYSFAQTRPAFLLEEPYDQEGPDGLNFNGNATQPTRRFQWGGWLSTIGGYVSGNGYVWMFNAGWQTHLSTQCAQDMARLNAFIRSKAWWTLKPEGLGGMKTIVTNKAAFPDIAAAGTTDGSLTVVYVYPGYSGTFTVDMSVMSHTFTAKWFDPTSATYTTIGTFSPSGTHTFSLPGNNSAGDNDWALVFE